MKTKIFVLSLRNNNSKELSEWPAIEKATQVLDGALKILASK
jgi:hypothetical protein